MKRTLLILPLIALAFIAGYYIGRQIGRQKSDISPVLSLRTSYLGLKKTYVDYGKKEVIKVWLPFGAMGRDSNTGEDFIFFQREIPFSGDELSVIKNAVELLLKGPSSEEKERGAYSLIPGGKIKDIKIADSNLTINFSKEFSPGGGSLAQWQARVAVEEVVRQFPSVKSLSLLVEGRSDALEP